MPSSDRPCEIQAVLFDMDGTLCDTEPAWMRAEHAMAERYGADLDRTRTAWPSSASNLIDSGVYIKARMQLEQGPEQVVDELVDRVVAVIAERGVEWRAGRVGARRGLQ